MNQDLIKIVSQFRGQGALYLIALIGDLKRSKLDKKRPLKSIEKTLIKKGVDSEVAKRFCKEDH